MARKNKSAWQNRLGEEKSPYLLQHRHNPVDWRPWGEEALRLAREQDKPIFLSVGYSTCHWCHVMAHESFEDERVAGLLNEHFVSVKVDREERPDIDEIYMNVTQALTGRGGWPNSVFLTPDGRPWFAGTYWPREDREGQPGFVSLLQRLAELWQDRRRDVEAQADQIASAVRQMNATGFGKEAAAPSRSIVDLALDEIRGSFDRKHGGLAGAPKFPPHGILELLLYEFGREKDEDLRGFIELTLDGMARGGIHDQVGGGFHRYSTDDRWFLPHFEKMLYDNAQLAASFARGWEATGREEFRQTARGICDWALREMRDAGGGFFSAYDADSEGVEGKFYVWTKNEIMELLGPEEGERFCRVYGVENDGNYREEHSGQPTGMNILYLPRPLDYAARVEAMDGARLRGKLRDQLEILRRRRDGRVRPGLDDKVLTSWNGLMIKGLAVAGRILGDKEYVAAAEGAAEFVLANLRQEGRLLVSYREGSARLNGYLDDYAFLASGLLELHEATGQERWVDEARELAEVMLDQYYDDNAKGFYFTSEDHELLLVRSKNPFDRAIPSGNGVAAQVLVRLAELLDEPRYEDIAMETIEAFWPYMLRAPLGTESLILAAAKCFDRGTVATVNRSGPATGEPADASARQGPVLVETFLSHDEVGPGDEVLVALRVEVDEGVHINSAHPGQDYLLPTAVTVKARGASAGRIDYPPGDTVQTLYDEELLSVYQGVSWIVVPMRISNRASLGEMPVRIELHAQPCTDKECMSPVRVGVDVKLQVRREAQKAPLRHGELFAQFGVVK